MTDYELELWLQDLERQFREVYGTLNITIPGYNVDLVIKGYMSKKKAMKEIRRRMYELNDILLLRKKEIELIILRQNREND